MPYALTVEKRNNYLFVTVTGENLYETVQRYLFEVHELCIQKKCRNVLIVENLTGPSLDTYSIYDLISRNSPQAALAVTRIAYVDINPAHKFADMKFAEDVAVNRGLTVKVCATIHAAQEWMEQQVRSEK